MTENSDIKSATCRDTKQNQPAFMPEECFLQGSNRVISSVPECYADSAGHLDAEKQQKYGQRYGMRER